MTHRILLTGGGTGGHVYPALSVAEQLQTDNTVEGLLYIGAKGHLEEKLAQAQGIEFIGLEFSGMPRKLSPKIIIWFWQFLKSIAMARALIEVFKPTVILGTGGYASAPVLAAALLGHRPYVIHEPDAHAGLVNRIFGRYARLVSLGMEAGNDQIGVTKERYVVNGNPVSSRFLKMPNRKKALAELGLDPHKKTVVITGGSQGAQALNKAVYDMLPMIIAEKINWLQIVHQVGDKNWDEMQATVPSNLKDSSFYKPRKYFDNLEVAYAACDLAICRAGAMTLSELFVAGVPAILVPYPHAAQDHQTHNAKFVESQGGAKMIVQSDLTPERLYALITDLLQDKTKLSTMRNQMLALAKRNAASDLAEQLKQIN